MLKKKRLNITEDQKNKCNTIIHSHSLMCGGVGTGMAQIPLADNAVITPIQIAMIIELGLVFDQKISKTIAQSIISGASASLIGRGVSQVLFGWIPGLGNAINTATAAGVTEAIGWMAVDRFSKEKFYDDSIDGESTDHPVTINISEEDTALEGNINDGSEEEAYTSIKEAAQSFFNGEKTYDENRDEYEEVMEKLESMLIELPEGHELKTLYNDFCDLPFK